MADTMNHLERAMASLQDKPVDRLCTYPLAMGVCRRLVGDGKMTYKDWVSDPKKFAAAFIEGQKYFNFDFAIGLMDLSVAAGDLGATVRMDEQNTPFVTDPAFNTPEDYEKVQVPPANKGRSGVLVEGTKLFVDALGKEVVTAGFLEGPLLRPLPRRPMQRRSSWTCTTTGARSTRPSRASRITIPRWSRPWLGPSAPDWSGTTSGAVTPAWATRSTMSSRGSTPGS
jgi:hypothetical protein